MANMYDHQYEVTIHRAGSQEVAEFQSEDRSVYFFDLDHLHYKTEEWKILMPNIRPFYAIKCNNQTPILKVLHHQGAGYDCASLPEITDVLSIGAHPADDIVYAQPAKMDTHMEQAVKHGVELTVYDNEDELQKMKKKYPNARLLLRIKAFNDLHGMADKFGCEMDEVKGLLSKAKELGFEVKGVCFHVGPHVGMETGCAFKQGIERAKLVMDIGKDLGFTMNMLDLGGGFPGGAVNDGVTMEELSKTIQSTIEKQFPSRDEVTVIAEPGRYFTTMAAKLFVKIIGKKRIKTGNADDPVFYYSLNDGMFGSFNNYGRVTTIWKEGTGQQQLYVSKLWGPTCTPKDLLVQKCHLPELNVGDWMCFYGVGAYGLEMHSTFNGMQRPRVIFTGSQNG